MIGAYVLIVAAVIFVWFCLGLRARLDAVAGDATAGRLVTVLSAVGAVLMVAAGMTSASVAGDVSGGGDPLPVDGSAAFIPMALPVLWFLAVAITGLTGRMDPATSG